MIIALHKLDQANLIRCVFLRVADRAEIEVPVFLKAKHRHILLLGYAAVAGDWRVNS